LGIEQAVQMAEACRSAGLTIDGLQRGPERGDARRLDRHLSQPAFQPRRALARLRRRA